MLESTYVGILVGYYITANYFKMVESIILVGYMWGILVGYYITAYYFKMVESTYVGVLSGITSHTILKW